MNIPRCPSEEKMMKIRNRLQRRKLREWEKSYRELRSTVARGIKEMIKRGETRCSFNWYGDIEEHMKRVSRELYVKGYDTQMNIPKNNMGLKYLFVSMAKQREKL